MRLNLGVSDLQTAESRVQVPGKAETLDSPAIKKAEWYSHLENIFSGPEDPNYVVCTVVPYRIEYATMQAKTPRRGGGDRLPLAGRARVTMPESRPWRWLSPFLLVLLLASTSAPAEACTLWGAVGEAAAGGGSLVAKNRDWTPDQRQELGTLRPVQGFHAVVLWAVGGAEPGVKAGVNTQGLVIVSATANQVPAAERRKIGQTRGLTAHLLTRCATVADVLREIELFRRPVFYLIGDRREIAVIEVAPDGRRAVSRTASGTLSHTNHYCAIDLPGLAGKPGAGSLKRQARIAEMLGERRGPFGVEDFIRMSADRNAGPENSIWRTGAGPGKTRTLAAWVVAVPPSGSPMIYLKTADPGAPERVCRITVEAALAAAAGGTIVLDGDPCTPDAPNS